MNILNFPLYSEVKVINILLILWIAGIVYYSLIYIHDLYTWITFQNRLKQIAVKKHVKDFIPDYNGENYTVYITTLVQVPLSVGYLRSIFLPEYDFNKKEIKYILNHEINHIKHYDFWIKQFVQILSIIYWWFYPVRKLFNQIDLFLEMRVDTKVTSTLSKEENLEYGETLLKLQSLMNNNLSKQMSYFSGSNPKILQYRMNYLLEGLFNKKTNFMILLTAFTLPIFSNLIILEPYFYNKSVDTETYNINDIKKSYIVHHKDGTYEIYIDGKSGLINDPTTPEFADLTIYEEGEQPK